MVAQTAIQGGSKGRRIPFNTRPHPSGYLAVCGGGTGESNAEMVGKKHGRPNAHQRRGYDLPHQTVPLCFLVHYFRVLPDRPAPLIPGHEKRTGPLPGHRILRLSGDLYHGRQDFFQETPDPDGDPELRLFWVLAGGLESPFIWHAIYPILLAATLAPIYSHR